MENRWKIARKSWKLHGKSFLWENIEFSDPSDRPNYREQGKRTEKRKVEFF
jgi:hypothetical protein